MLYFLELLQYYAGESSYKTNSHRLSKHTTLFFEIAVTIYQSTQRTHPKRHGSSAAPL